jgi:epsilon-lactone hydrolase
MPPRSNDAKAGQPADSTFTQESTSAQESTDTVAATVHNTPRTFGTTMTPTFTSCDSRLPFRKPSLKTPAEVNAKELNLHLGLQWLNRERHQTLIKIIRFLDRLLVSWWERCFFRLYNGIPVHVRRKICYMAWRFYFPLHKWLLGRSTGIHRDASLEYHALTTFLWCGRFFPVSIPRIRFALSQLSASHPTPLQSPFVEAIDDDCPLSLGITPPAVQRNYCRVKGLYAHHRSSVATNKNEYTLFWLYAGAFVAGDAAGNLSSADAVAAKCGMDVFLPTFRLGPEFQMNDILWDVALAYRWLYLLRKQRGQNPTKILLFGASSGAALCLRLMQSIAELERGEEILPAYVSEALRDISMPSGAALASLFVEFSTEQCDPQGSFIQYGKHDLIVNESAQAVRFAFADKVMNGQSVEHSPLSHSFAGLPPLCVVFSEHEVAYDETVRVVNAARAKGVRVTVGLWKYMCHAWMGLSGFVPEGQQAVNFVCDWYRRQQAGCIA